MPAPCATSTCRPASTSSPFATIGAYKTVGVGRIAARLIESLVAKPPLTMRKLVDNTRRCRWYGSSQMALA